jgi:hypothetical protein
MRRLRALPLVVAFVAPGGCGGAAGQAPRTAEAAPVELRPEDVATIDGVVKAYYDIVSGPAGEARPWARDRALYLNLPSFRFVSLDVKAGGAVEVMAMDHAQFAEWADVDFVKEGFFEQETHRVTQRAGNLVHVMSTYESRRTPDGPVIAHGVNSLDLIWDGKRWWIAASVWQNQDPSLPLPPEFLPPAK